MWRDENDSAISLKERTIRKLHWRKQLKFDDSTELQRLVTRVSFRKHNYRKMKSTFCKAKGWEREKAKGRWDGRKRET